MAVWWYVLSVWWNYPALSHIDARMHHRHSESMNCGTPILAVCNQQRTTNALKRTSSIPCLLSGPVVSIQNSLHLENWWIPSTKILTFEQFLVDFCWFRFVFQAPLGRYWLVSTSYSYTHVSSPVSWRSDHFSLHMRSSRSVFRRCFWTDVRSFGRSLAATHLMPKILTATYWAH